jgi:hypothetical protein
LIARWRNTQSRLRQSGMNAANQCQHDEGSEQFGSHKIIWLVFIVTHDYRIDLE